MPRNQQNNYSKFIALQPQFRHEQVGVVAEGGKYLCLSWEIKMAGVKVVSLNISWEANAYHLKTKLPTSLREWKQRVKGGSQWNSARHQWKHNYEKGVLGPAYVKSLRDLRKYGADIILLQEFQNYDDSLPAALNVLNGKHRTYAVGATDFDGTQHTQSGNVVVYDNTKFDFLSSHSSEVRSVLHMVTNAFPPGRPVAACMLRNRNDGGETLVISSHSGHGVMWNVPEFCQTALSVLEKLYGAQKPRLIWGGDFNERVKFGKPLSFCGQKVFKVRGCESKKTAHYCSHNRIDWILATSMAGKNPVQITDEKVRGASDHYIIGIETTAKFLDFLAHSHNV